MTDTQEETVCKCRGGAGLYYCEICYHAHQAGHCCLDPALRTHPAPAQFCSKCGEKICLSTRHVEHGEDEEFYIHVNSRLPSCSAPVYNTICSQPGCGLTYERRPDPAQELKIPEDLQQVYAVVNVEQMEGEWWCNYYFVARLIERIARLEGK